MNRILRSRLSIIAVLLVVPLIFSGCVEFCVGCASACLLASAIGCTFLYGFCTPVCIVAVCPICADILLCEYAPYYCPELLEQSQMAATPFCAEDPEECTATFEQFELAAIQFCEEYPEECQQAFDAYLESSEEEDSQ